MRQTPKLSGETVNYLNTFDANYTHACKFSGITEKYRFTESVANFKAWLDQAVIGRCISFRLSEAN